MLPTWKQLRHLFHDDDGSAATEYAAMLALIVIVCISAAQTLSHNLATRLNEFSLRMINMVR